MQCDGARPVCSTCAKEKNKGRCEYSVREGATSSIDDLKQVCSELETENYALRELLDYLSLGPEHAWEAFRRLRAETSDDSDPRRILRCIRDAWNAHVPNSVPVAGGQAINAIEHGALAGSAIRVPARPWTSVAGDGIVSSLISAFFKWDEPFAFAYVVRDLFLRDMRHGVPSQAKYCSPLLVNAICAIRSVSIIFRWF